MVKLAYARFSRVPPRPQMDCAPNWLRTVRALPRRLRSWLTARDGSATLAAAAGGATIGTDVHTCSQKRLEDGVS